MRILVVSDTHGKNKELIESLNQKEKPDLLFHLGDYVRDGIILADELKLSSIIVRGNGDHPSSGFREEEVLEIKGKKIYLTHGHKLGVNFNLNRIFYRARELRADIALFGHTHIPIVEEKEGILFMNPGSVSLPRDGSNKKTYGIIKIGEKTEIEIKEV